MDKPGLIDKVFVNTMIKKRPKDLHKGDCGRVLIVAGKKGMAGAAVLSAKGALRSGAGLVLVSVPDELFPVIQISVTEAVCISRTLLPDQLDLCRAIVIGPGLGDDVSNVKLIKNIIKSKCKAFILDADALNLAAKNPGLLHEIKNAGERVIITPHPGEAAKLLNCETGKIQKDRCTAALRLSMKTGAVTVLKGMGTLVATPDQKTYINTTGNPGMATGGTGDVLSGIIGALAGQGYSCLEAAISGVYIHGLAGDLAAARLGEHGLIASDVADMTAKAICRILPNAMPKLDI